MEKTKNIIVSISLLFLFILLSEPFFISSIYVDDGKIVFVLQFFLLLFLISLCYKQGISKTCITLSLALIFYSFLQMIFNFESIFSWLPKMINVFFCIFLWDLLKKNLVYRNAFGKILLYLCVFISVAIILESITFHCAPYLFYPQIFDGYVVKYNPILGMIYASRYRPYWFFIEPSYAAFFLGICLLFVFGYPYKKKASKYYCSIVIITAIILIQSYGTYISFIVTTCVCLTSYVLHLKNTLVNKLVYVSIFVAVLILPFYNTFKYTSNNETVASSSLGERQEKSILGYNVVGTMSAGDLLIGKGESWTADHFKMGLSDAYYKLFCEQGIIFLFLFFIIFDKFTKKSLFLSTFLLVNFLSIIGYLAPAIWLVIMLFRLQNNEKTLCVKD